MQKNNFETATFAAGCFWGVEELFRTTKGIIDTMAGYTGGNKKNPFYEDVCSDNTGHAEAVQIKFDPNQISFQKLVNIFFENHDPTTLNRQGPDTGTQYRSAIFYHSLEQKKIAEKTIQELEKTGKFKNKIVTQILPVKEFFKAEEYHQKYLAKRGQTTCHI